MSVGKNAGFHDAVVEILRAVAAGVILPRFNRLAESDVRTKAHVGDLVTIADEEAELLLAEKFLTLLPGSCVVGEEAASKDKSVLDLLAGDNPVWVVDPIDGTSNFVGGVERFGMIVALVRGGETVMGWIHDPLAGTTLLAERGAGAWQVGPDTAAAPRRIPGHTSPGAPDLSAMTVAFHHRVFAPYLRRFGSNLRLGSAAHDYWALAEGRIQLLSYRRLNPWDHAAGILIHSEAGGYARLLGGEPYRPARRNQEGLLCAPSAAVWESVAALVQTS